MNCDDFKRSLHDYFLGHLPREAREELDRHYASCADCGSLMALAQELTCKEFTDFLNEYVDGTMDEERRAVFERHLGICPDCSAYLQSYRAVMQMSVFAMSEAVASLPRELPADLVQAILAARRKGK